MKIYPAAKIRNITIMGHGGTGKTSVAEALLLQAKAIDRMGKTSDGNTVMDFDAEEQRRGISINTTYAALEWRDCKFNLIDTPGEFDFLAEQRLGLRAGDIILLVVSAKDGVAVGAEKALRTAAKRNKPVALCFNRLDESNASFDRTLQAFIDVYGNRIVPLGLPIYEKENMVGIVDLVTSESFKFDGKGGLVKCEIPEGMEEQVEKYHSTLQEQIATTDEAMMEKYFAGEAFTKEEEERGITNAIEDGSLIPVFPASAVRNEGMNFLMDRIWRFFPSPELSKPVKAKKEDGSEFELPLDPNGPTACFVFKTIVDPFVGRISMFRVFSGTVKAENLYNPKKDKEERINSLYVLRGKKQIPVDHLVAGDIGAFTKLIDTQTNDTLCAAGQKIFLPTVEMPKPCLSRALKPKTRGDEDKIMQGMLKLKDEDTSFVINNDAETKQILLSCQGEVQVDVLCAKLKQRYGVELEALEPRVPYRETIRKKVKVQGKHKKQSGGHGQYGDVWIEFEPGEEEKLVFEEKVFGGAVPKNYFPAVEKGLQEAVVEGVLAGYPVVHLKATLVDGSYHDVDSSEMSFKLAARLAYRNGLPQANPVLLEPIYAMKVHLPEENLGDIMGDLSKRRGRIMSMGADVDAGFQVVEAEAPASELSSYATELRSMTQGRGWFAADFARYEQAPSEIADKVIAAAKQEE